MLPVIVNYARGAFSKLDREARQEHTQEVIANAMVAYVRLFEQGRVELAYPTVLAMYAIRQVKDGRKVGTTLNVKDISSEYCQLRKHLCLERLDHMDRETGQWCEVLIEDRHAGPADTARARIDLADWFATLRPRDRKIAGALAVGERTTDVARRFRVSQGRISQMRDEFHNSWTQFQHELPNQQAKATSA